MWCRLDSQTRRHMWGEFSTLPQEVLSSQGNNKTVFYTYRFVYEHIIIHVLMNTLQNKCKIKDSFTLIIRLQH